MHLRTSSIWTKTNASLDEEWKELSQECVLLSHKCPAQLPGSCHDCEVTSCPVQKGSASLTPVAQSRLPRCLEGSQPNWAVFRLLVLKYTLSNTYSINSCCLKEMKWPIINSFSYFCDHWNQDWMKNYDQKNLCNKI